MKISDNIISVTDITTNTVEKKSPPRGRELFYNKLKGLQLQDTYNYIAEFTEKISEQGERLAQKMDINELRHYKKTVSEFLQYLVNNSFSFERETTSDRCGRISVFSSVKKINEKLEELTKEVLEQENGNLSVLKLLDDIRGLIIDIIM